MNESYDGFDIGHGSLKEIINNLVQHPIPIEPPAEPGAPPAKPIMLTKKVFRINSGTKEIEATKPNGNSERSAIQNQIGITSC